MCREVFNLVCSMDQKNLELQIALHCAPAITGIKASNLFILPEYEEASFRRLLEKSSLSYFYLTTYKGNAAYLVFRRKRLEEKLGEAAAAELLQGFGYDVSSLGTVLRRFRERYEAYLIRENGEFPHEIGILLGYATDDVIGFISNKGKDFLYIGYWKVYSDPEEKKKIFEQYEASEEKLVRMIAANYHIRSIIKIYEEQSFAAAV